LAKSAGKKASFPVTDKQLSSLINKQHRQTAGTALYLVFGLAKRLTK